MTIGFEGARPEESGPWTDGQGPWATRYGTRNNDRSPRLSGVHRVPNALSRDGPPATLTFRQISITFWRIDR
jgi:hypothetical protein